MTSASATRVPRAMPRKVRASFVPFSRGATLSRARAFARWPGRSSGTTF
jgi:hypothetical protein